LCGNKLRIVDESVLVLVVGLEDGVDHIDKFTVLEDLGLWHGPSLVVMVGGIMPMYQRFHKFASVQLIIAVRIVHLEVMKL